MTKIASTAESSSATELSGKTILHDFGAPLFVWGVWALMLLVALAFVGTYSANVPFWDDFFMYVDALTGEQPITVTWLWGPTVGPHRLPLPKLILLGLYRLSGDFRAAMFFNVLALGALAFAMIWTAGRLRGRMDYSDAFFPLALLHPGHCPCLLWSTPVEFPPVLAGTLLLIIVWGDAQLRLGTAILAGICLVLLPLCGGPGLALVPALALWLGYIGVHHWRSREPHGRRYALLILGLVSSVLLLVTLYLHGLPNSNFQMKGSSVWATLQSSILFLSLGFGPPYAVPLERLLGWRVALWVIALGVAGLLLFSTVILVATSLKQPQERPRALGLLMFLGAMISLALVIGSGRPGSAGFEGRYAILAVPALCCVYFVWSIYGRPTAGYLIRTSLFLYIIIMLLLNLNYGIIHGRYHKHMMDSFFKDLRAGMPNFMLSGRYSPLIYPTTEGVHDKLAMLHRAGMGKFRFLRGDPAFREVSLPVASAALHQMTWEEGTARGTGADPYLVLTLPETTFVGGIRFKYSHPTRGDDRPEPFLISWKRDGQHSFTEAQSSHLSTVLGNAICGAPREEAVMVWVGDSLKQFRIRPDPDFRLQDARPGIFRISEVVLLVPVDEQFGGHTGEDDGYEALRSPRACFFTGPYVWPVRIRDTLKVFLRDAISGVP